MVSEEFERSGSEIHRILGVENSRYVSSMPDVADRRLSAENSWWQAFLRGGQYAKAGGDCSSIRALDLFSGCGGLSLGVREAVRAFGYQWDSIGAVDVDGAALDLYQHNLLPEFTLNADVSSLVDYMVLGAERQARFAYPPEIVHDQLSKHVGEVDILMAGPPCQGHSNLNNKTRRDDPRNLLYVTTIAIAVALQARTILVENVPDVIRDKNSVVFSAMALLESAGYKFIHGHVLRADLLGGAQTRRRYFLTAVRADMPTPGPTLQAVAEGLRRRPNSVRWAIGDLASASLTGIMNTVPALSAENRERVDYLFDNEVNDLPNHVRPACHRDGTTYKAVYGRMFWDRPAPTITTGFLSPGRGRFVHPGRRRVITPHEAARLQFFPDSYNFVPFEAEPARGQLGKWIGDAVPPLLGYAAAIPLMSSLAFHYE